MTDPFLTVLPSNPLHLLGSVAKARPGAPRRTAGGIISGGINVGAQLGRQLVDSGLNYGKVIAELVLGFIGIVGGAVLAYLFKDKSLADVGSKILMILGVISSGFGIKNVVQIFSATKQAQARVEPTRLKVRDEATATACRDKWRELTTLEPRLKKPLDPSNLSLINNLTPELKQLATDLLTQYTNPSVGELLDANDGGPPPLITNISDEPISLPEFKDRVALFLGSVGTVDVDPLRKFLPKDFVDVFTLARWYANNQRGKNDSIQDIVGGNDKIQLLQKLLESTLEGNTKKTAFEYLTSLQNAENYLKVLLEVINYVMKEENTTDPKVARNVAILRQALKRGLGITGDTLDEIHAEFKKVINGEEATAPGDVNKQGLRSKLEALDKHFRKREFTDIVSKPGFPFTRTADSIRDNPVLKNLSLAEFAEK